MMAEGRMKKIIMIMFALVAITSERNGSSLTFPNVNELEQSSWS
jgi:hypothetical protein